MEDIEYIDSFKTSDNEWIFDRRYDLYVIASYELDDDLGLTEDIEIETDDFTEAENSFEMLKKHFKKIGDCKGK